MLTERDKIKAHKHTIKVHRKAVRKWCFMMGIPLRGLLHDRSKYSKIEMSIAHWYTGTKSPHDVARAELGYSPSWWHHKSRNDHHWEMWLDFNSGEMIDGQFVIKPVAVKMDYNAVIEMFCDYVGAGMAYSKDKWTQNMPLDYHNAHKNTKLYHDSTLWLFEKLLAKLAALGPKDFVKWYKQGKKELKNMYEKRNPLAF